MKEFRPRLPDTESWLRLIEYGREHGPKEILERFLRTFNNSKEQTEFKEEGLDYVISSESERIKTLEDLLEHSEVDTDRFEVKRYITNKWDQHSVDKGLVELYQVKAWLMNKYLNKPDASFYDKWLKGLERIVEPISVRSTSTDKPIVVTIADLHVGAVVEGERLIPDYNVTEVKDRLAYVASVVNGYERPVHLKFLGDFIESFTGKNHKDTWKQIELHGMEAALTAYDTIWEFIQQINDVLDVDIVGGNHDRISSSNEDDKSGQVAYLISELLRRFTDLPVRYEARIMTCEHDGVCFVLTHGDKRITKAQPSQLILEYGNQNMFNVMLNAHGHEELIHKNSVKFQARQVPPIFVPNKYALDNGWTSHSGFTVIESSERGGVNIQTYTV